MADPPQEEVLAALEELLGWPAIARSPQLARFLTYIVSAKLRGEESAIKAYAIAVDVFGRPPSFDPQSDPIVRVQARRLRALLDQFYDEGRARTRVRIELPVGRYVPEFHRIEAGAEGASEGAKPDSVPVAAKARRVSRRQLRNAGLAAGLVLALGLVLFALTRPSAPGVTVPTEPRVLVGAFSNVSGVAALDSLETELAAGVRAALAPFEDLDVRPDDPSPSGAPLPAGTYRLTGVIHPAPNGIEVTATLTGHEGEALWGA
ncbi:MAG TPA: hypothetical protein GYA10_13160, partial [Alphaproteobacteria bacterium]|nr:hypothetical protein [Alphaproteobacteria bacterium]